MRLPLPFKREKADAEEFIRLKGLWEEFEAFQKNRPERKEPPQLVLHKTCETCEGKLTVVDVDMASNLAILQCNQCNPPIVYTYAFTGFWRREWKLVKVETVKTKKRR